VERHNGVKSSTHQSVVEESLLFRYHLYLRCHIAGIRYGQLPLASHRKKMLPGHKIHDSVAYTVDGISTVRSATILQNIEGCEKVHSKDTQHRRLWKN